MAKKRTALAVHDELVRTGDEHDTLVRVLRSKKHSEAEYQRLQGKISEHEEHLMSLRDVLCKVKVPV